ncbi:MAG: carbohydrate ABC transporter permease [Nitrososphaerota archaeon]|nr:carbohydrate ABC transporter permease [Nitrososphaerota archaeon]
MKGTTLLLAALLAAMALFYAFPLYWTLVTSLKTNLDVFSYPPSFLPPHPTLSNFYSAEQSAQTVTQTAIGSLPWMLNSSLIALMSSLISTFAIGAPSAYALTRHIKRRIWPARMILFMTMLPEAAFVVPYYIITRNLLLLNNWFGLMLVYLSFTAPFATWLLMGFFNAIPMSIEEASQIDGLSPFETFYKISLKIVIPGVITVLILNFISCWNEFLYALTMTYTPFPSGAQTVQVFMAGFVVIEKGVAWGGLAAAGIFAMLPGILLAVLAQKYLTRGFTWGGTKGV